MDLEFVVRKINGWEHNPKYSSTTKVDEPIQSRFSMSTVSYCKNIEIKHHVYKGKDCMSL